MSSLWKQFYNKIKPINLEIGTINRKYNFAPLSQRSDEDNAKYFELYRQIDNIRYEFNSAHVINDCPECGGPRSASSGTNCINVFGCTLAKYL